MEIECYDDEKDIVEGFVGFEKAYVGYNTFAFAGDVSTDVSTDVYFKVSFVPPGLLLNSSGLESEGIVKYHENIHITGTQEDRRLTVITHDLVRTTNRIPSPGRLRRGRKLVTPREVD